MMTPRKHNPMMRMLKRAARARREHGIALLFTLCILSMALITAMIFSSTASTGRKVATAYVDTSSARILADGAVSRAILALMQSDNAPYVCSNYNTNKPGNANADDYASDWIWKMEKSGLFSFNNGPLRFGNSLYYDREDARCPSWEYVYTTNYGETASRIYGRYAYVAIGMNDQLNPNAIGRRDYGDFDETLFRKRLGRWTCEPQFVFKSIRNKWDYTTYITPKKIEENYKKTEEEKGWADLDLFINDMTGGGSSTADKQLKMMADQYFDVSNLEEYNKFRADGNGIGDLTKHELASGESYRFPLIRNDWDSISVDTVKAAIPWFKNSNQAFVNQTIANLINYNAKSDRPAVTDKDNWLTATPTYTGNKRTPYINEVEADVSVGGNLGVRLSERYLADPNDTKSWKWRIWYTECTYNHQITINVETVNMYPNTGGSDGTLPVQPPKLIGEIRYDYTTDPASNRWATQVVPFNADTSWDVSSIDNGGYRVYTFILDSRSIGSMTTPKRDGYDVPMGHEADFYPYVKIRNVKVSLDRIVLYDSAGRNADLALMPTALQSGRTFVQKVNGEQVAGPGDPSKHSYFDAQVNDPRCNLARTEWTAIFAEDESKLNSTLGEVNNTINLGTYHDNEKRTDPAYAGNDSISTAYIRHGQMISLWELGAIHRGTAWQTVNLKCAPAKNTRMGMDRYDYGDGHLLDQVALTRSTANTDDTVVGMINLNCVANFGGSNAPFVFKSLFTDFPIYQTYANMNSGNAAGGTVRGGSVDSSDNGSMSADVYARDLSEAVTYAISKGHLRRRTAVFPTSFPSSDSQMNRIIPKNVPDAQSEEIFSRVVNLLKWNQQQTRRATVLVLAQTIRDVGGVPLETNLPDNDVDLLHDAGYLAYNVTDSTKKITSLDAGSVRSNVKSNGSSTQYRRYDNLFDQITGEVKIVVRLEWDESANENKGAWKITRREYAE